MTPDEMRDLAEKILTPARWSQTDVERLLALSASALREAARRITELEWQLYGNAGRGKPDLTPPASPPGAQPARNTPHPHDR